MPKKLAANCSGLSNGRLIKEVPKEFEVASNWIPNRRYLRERVKNKLRDSFWIPKKSLDGSGKKERRSGRQVLEALMSVGRNTVGQPGRLGRET